MAKQTLNFGIVVFLALALSSCSLFSRKNEQAQTEKPATPLDLPKEDSAPEPMADATVTPNANPSDSAVSGTGATPSEEPINMVDKDGNPVKANKLDIQMPDGAKKEAVPPVVHEWSYEGDTGPAHWGELKPEFAVCNIGKLQSPIDLKWHKPVKGSPLKIVYKPVKAHVENNGHNIELTFDAGSHITLKGQEYDLLSAHFHAHSEHTLSGKEFPMEMHLVHKDKDGKPAVIAVFLQTKKSNAAIERIWNAIPVGKDQTSADLIIDPSSLLPAAHTFYMYEGSFTTPPCTEGVKWIVMNNPMNISKEQLDAFKQLYPNNARPVQPLGGRKVVNY